MKQTHHSIHWAALFGAALLSACSHASETSNDTQPAVTLAVAHYSSIAQTINATGRVGSPAGTQTKLSFLVPGIVQRIDVRIGDRVSAGDVLAQLDESGLVLSAQQAAADARAAVANAEQTAVDRTSMKIAVDEAQVRREESLYAAGIAARKDIEAAQAQLAADNADALSNRSQIRSANAQSQSAQVRSSLAQRDLANGTLRAPSDGVVVGIFHREGESVDTSTPVIAMGPPLENAVTLEVAASDAMRMHSGDLVHLSIIGSPLQGTGRVAGVSTAIDAATQTATVVVNGVPRGAVAGAAVQANITIDNESGIVIPQSALVQDPQSGETVVFVLTQDPHGNKRFAQQSVHVAFDNGTDALISSGLRAGERVAAQGAFALLAPAGSGD